MIRTLILVVYGTMLLLLSLRSLRKHRLQERYAILFFVTGLPFLVLAIWPDGVVWISELLAIERPTTLVLGLAAFTILLLLKLFSVVSVQQRQIAALAQHVAMLTARQKDADTTGLESANPTGTPADPNES